MSLERRGFGFRSPFRSAAPQRQSSVSARAACILGPDLARNVHGSDSTSKKARADSSGGGKVGERSILGQAQPGHVVVKLTRLESTECDGMPECARGSPAELVASIGCEGDPSLKEKVEDAKTAARGKVPHSNRVVQSTARESPAIGAEGYARDRILMPFETARFLS